MALVSVGSAHGVSWRRKASLRPEVSLDSLLGDLMLVSCAIDGAFAFTLEMSLGFQLCPNVSEHGIEVLDG